MEIEHSPEPKEVPKVMGEHMRYKVQSKVLILIVRFKRFMEKIKFTENP